jgi:hypothetical protein
MREVGLIVSFLFVCARLGISAESGAPDWSMNASINEACSVRCFASVISTTNRPRMVSTLAIRTAKAASISANLTTLSK